MDRTYSMDKKDKKCLQNSSWKSRRKDHLGDQCIYEKVILKRILKKQDVRVWTGFIWLRVRSHNRFL
jgi:hypothetical protein